MKKTDLTWDELVEAFDDFDGPIVKFLQARHMSLKKLKAMIPEDIERLYKERLADEMEEAKKHAEIGRTESFVEKQDLTIKGLIDFCVENHALPSSITDHLSPRHLKRILASLDIYFDLRDVSKGRFVAGVGYVMKTKKNRLLNYAKAQKILSAQLKEASTHSKGIMTIDPASIEDVFSGIYTEHESWLRVEDSYTGYEPHYRLSFYGDLGKNYILQDMFYFMKTNSYVFDPKLEKAFCDDIRKKLSRIDRRHNDFMTKVNELPARDRIKPLKPKVAALQDKINELREDYKYLSALIYTVEQISLCRPTETAIAERRGACASTILRTRKIINDLLFGM
jgi:hypothetical protein